MSAVRKVDALVVGGSFAGAAAAKRLTDAGFETVVLERKKLPRHKICSGILSPRGHRFLLENFGPLPREILHEPTSTRGVVFHYPSGLRVPMDFDGGPTPHLHRRYSDHWALLRSGAEIHDLTTFAGLTDHGNSVTVDARREGEPVRYRARVVIGADGPISPVVRALHPDWPEQQPWFMVGQKFHSIVRCDLSADYFHFWFHPALGYYTWSHARDGRQIVGAGFEQGQNFNDAHAEVVDYLRAKHGVELGPGENVEASPENFGLSLVNRYVFGRGNVVVTGQAAGFLNMIGEGMSCALHSGAIAGESVALSLRHGEPLQRVYRAMIQSEVRRCTDQWNPLKIAFGRPHEADFKAALMALSWRERATVVSETWAFLKLYAKFSWGRQILHQAADRLFRGGYDSRRWV